MSEVNNTDSGQFTGTFIYSGGGINKTVGRVGSRKNGVRTRMTLTDGWICDGERTGSEQQVLWAVSGTQSLALTKMWSREG